jgi:FAD/FMN-containing dehydrogenase
MSFERLPSELSALGDIVSTEPDVLETHACDRSGVNRQGTALDQLPYLFFVYGHIGDGNIHLSAWAGGTMGEVAHEMDEIVYGGVRRVGGSISAEHGIGALKRAYLGHSRSAAEIAVMRRIKAALDPKGILDPGKVI